MEVASLDYTDTHLVSYRSWVIQIIGVSSNEMIFALKNAESTGVLNVLEI